MTTETKSTLRKELVGMSREAQWERLITKVDDLSARVRELEWESTK